jgi:excinuclease UvrABC nuclease subunit
MSSMQSGRSPFAVVGDRPGVYLIVDLDERPLYVGKSNRVRNRLLEHFVGQNSSVTADGILDLYDVLRVYVWYCDKSDLGACETAASLAFKPRWNRADIFSATSVPELKVSDADEVIGIHDSPEELARRRDPLERAENKLLHLLRAVRKVRVSGASQASRQLLRDHAQELVDILNGDL